MVLGRETGSPDWRTIFPTKHQIESALECLAKSQPFRGLPSSMRSKFFYGRGSKCDCADRVRRFRRLQHETSFTPLQRSVDAPGPRLKIK